MCSLLCGIPSNPSKYWFGALTTIGNAEMRCVAMSPLAARLARPNLRFLMITGRTQSPRDWDGGALFSLVDKLIDNGRLYFVLLSQVVLGLARGYHLEFH